MKTTGLLLALVAAVFAAPHGYNLGEPSDAGLSSGPGADVAASVDIDSGEGVGVACREGEVLHVDGTCHIPEITRKVYVFDIPAQERPIGPAPSLPPPSIDHNILFVRLPEEGPGPEPIVLPPPRQENIVYVLKKQEEQVPQVIEVPAQSQVDPEIYFVNYQDGENPTLPIGVDLETALGVAASADGQVLGGADGEGGIGGAVGFGAVGEVEISDAVGGHGTNVLGIVNGAGVAIANGAGAGLGVNGGGVNGGSGLNGFAGGRPSGIYTTP